MSKVENFYDEHYEDANHFYTYVRGVAVLSPKKIQQAMTDFHNQQKDVSWQDLLDKYTWSKEEKACIRKLITLEKTI